MMMCRDFSVSSLHTEPTCASRRDPVNGMMSLLGLSAGWVMIFPFPLFAAIWGLGRDVTLRIQRN